MESRSRAESQVSLLSEILSGAGMLTPQPVGHGFLVRGQIRPRGIFLAGLGVHELTLVVDLIGDYAAGGLPPVLRLSVICDTVIPGPVPAVTLHPNVFFP